MYSVSTVFRLSYSVEQLIFLTTLLTKHLWPQSKLQYEYAGSNVKFDELQFNLFVAGELEIISNKKIDEIENR